MEGWHMLAQDSPLAASDLGNLDCKKAAISLSSSRSLWRRTIGCFYLSGTGVPRSCTSCLMSPGWTGESSRDERILIDCACWELTAASTRNLPLDPLSHTHWLMREGGLSRLCHLSETNQNATQRHSVTLTNACSSAVTANSTPQTNNLRDSCY